MYFIIVSIVMLCLSLKEKTSGRVISFSVSLLLPFLFLNVYFNGEDWVNYHDFFQSAKAWYPPEVTFYFTLFLLKIISFSDFKFAIFIFYLLSFLSIYNLFFNSKHVLFYCVKRYYLLFISLVVVSLGPTLLLEQLRQFMALIFFLYAISSFSSGRKFSAFVFLLLSVTSHVSAIILFLFSLLSFFTAGKLKYLFCVLLLCILICIFILILNGHVFSSFFLAFIQEKISRYLTVSTPAIGLTHLLYFPYVVYFLLIYKEKNRSIYTNFFNRLAFSGALIYLLSCLFGFLTRFSSYYIVVYSLCVAFELVGHQRSIKNLGLILLSCIIFFNGASYYSNPIAPIKFFNIKSELFIDERSVGEKYHAIKKNAIDKIASYGY